MDEGGADARGPHGERCFPNRGVVRGRCERRLVNMTKRDGSDLLVVETAASVEFIG
jgi:hypothetical protein